MDAGLPGKTTTREAGEAMKEQVRRRVRRILWGVAIAIGAAGLRVPAASDAPRVDLIQIDNQIINPVVLRYIETAIARAEQDGAACLIIELDTPGGLLESTRDIVKAFMASKVPIVVYVAPSGARAASAGVFITMAAHVAAMAPSTAAFAAP